MASNFPSSQLTFFFLCFIMPVPVKSAKSSLTEEAARVIDEAVAVAHSRNNAQTHSLHAVSALLASPSSILQEACVQTRRSDYNVRLQVRALEFLVGISLDRLPSSKSDEDDGEPPVSNSLMAVIRRAQTTQKRNPDNFQLQQIHSFHQLPSHVKVGVKHFTLSILDDPVVSRVFEEAGFCSIDVRLCIMLPERYPIVQPLPPILHSERRRIVEAFKNEDIDENSRVIGDLLVETKHGMTRRNPLLLGVCSITALAGFIGIVSKKRSGVVPEELSGLKVVSLDIPIFKYTCHGVSEEQLEEKFMEVESTVEQYCLSEPGVVVNFGELGAFVDFRVSDQATNFVVSKLSRLFKIKKGNFWLMGTCLYYETYFKFQEMFPTLEHDWDLHLLPVSSKSSFLKSFVPLAGFFSWSNARNQQPPPSRICYVCTEKYEQEIKEKEKKKGERREKGEDDGRVRLYANVLKLQKKWIDICTCQHQCNSSENSQMKRASASPPIIIVQHSTNVSSSSSKDPISFKIEDERPSCPSHTNDVTTDLALGTIYESVAATQDAADLPKSQDHHLQNTSTPDVKDFKALRRVFAEKVSYQDDAICTISEAVSRCRNGSKSRGDIWLHFLGPDKIGKKKIASALAEIMFGNKENVISVDFSSRDGFCHSNSIFGCQESNDFSLKFHGRNDACYVAWALRKKPRSIIFLENVDKADDLLQSNLSQAIKTGKFPNPYGDISIANMIFMTTLTSTGGDSVSKRKADRFSEEIILGARSWQMQILVSEFPNLEQLKKRKLIQGTTESPKRGHKSLRCCLDLNLPTGEADADSGDYYDTDLEKRIVDWLEDFRAQVDETVVFKPFNFDGVAVTVMKEIELQCRRTFGSGVILEVDHEVIVQVIAAAWISGRNEVIEDWVEKVLGRSFSEVQEKYHPTARSVVKVAVCEDPLVEEFVPGLCLPGQIIV
ncbi:hypothetical protein EZV62_024776 [Acer yangbiense]|uniref:Clp R domain-containing protein n=1 Tax=Acer yangbiense TaxID=1000413 RepID=A0A5C7GWE8_9ROSI|nr:hypothetical protein EZV62_024776 [Acer yangbiense]